MSERKGIDGKKSLNAEVDALLADSKTWAANGNAEPRDPTTGCTPLHVAAAKGYVEVVKILLKECNVEPDCVDDEGWSPLHAAVHWGKKETAEILLKYGADSQLKNYAGKTCLDVAHRSIATWLEETIIKTSTRHRNKININININKRKLSPPQQEVKRVDNKIVNDKPPAPEIMKVPESKPPKGRAPSPENAEPETTSTDELPSWRRSASFRNRQQEPTRDNRQSTNNNVDNDTIQRRTHSFENDKTSFVPPVRDEESETQRKAHAKRVRESRGSTQGVTLDEKKSAEQLAKKKTGNGNAEPAESSKKKTGNGNAEPAESSKKKTGNGNAEPAVSSKKRESDNAVASTSRSLSLVRLTLPKEPEDNGHIRRWSIQGNRGSPTPSNIDEPIKISDAKHDARPKKGQKSDLAEPATPPPSPILPSENNRRKELVENKKQKASQVSPLDFMRLSLELKERRVVATEKMAEALHTIAQTKLTTAQNIRDLIEEINNM